MGLMEFWILIGCSVSFLFVICCFWLIILFNVGVDKNNETAEDMDELNFPYKYQ